MAYPHIECQADYDLYKSAYDDSTKGYDIVCNAYIEDEEPWFSYSPCDICNRRLGGDRLTMHLTNPGPGEIVEVSACTDCQYYAEYGQLDDMTMLDYDLEN